jgi:hypothetical protein
MKNLGTYKNLRNFLQKDKKTTKVLMKENWDREGSGI